MNCSIKRGSERHDGFVFWAYHKKTAYQYWVTKTKFKELIDRKNSSLRQWRLKNKKHSAEWRKKDRIKNLDKRRTQSASWAKRNPQKAASNLRKWKTENREKCVAVEEKRRAMKFNAIPGDYWEKAVDGFFAISERISKCTGIKHAVDHIIPISRGGSHCHRNLQVIPFSLNSRKGAKLDFILPNCYRSDGWYSVKNVRYSAPPSS